MRTKKMGSNSLTFMQKLSQPLVERIYQEYLDKGGTADESVKSYIHAFFACTYRTVEVLKTNRHDYQEIFDNILSMDQSSFYKMVFSKGNKITSFVTFVLPCCLLKNLCDGDFSQIALGGSAPKLLEEIINQRDIAYDQGDDENVVALAEEWGISSKKVYYLTKESLDYKAQIFLECNTIQPLNHELNSELFKEVLLNNLPTLQERFAMELGVYGILKDPTRRIEKEVVGEWTKRVSFSENSPQVLNS